MRNPGPRVVPGLVGRTSRLLIEVYHFVLSLNRLGGQQTSSPCQLVCRDVVGADVVRHVVVAVGAVVGDIGRGGGGLLRVRRGRGGAAGGCTQDLTLREEGEGVYNGDDP